MSAGPPKKKLRQIVLSFASQKPAKKYTGIFTDEYTVCEVPSDGDCMFASIALGLGWPHTAETVRQDIVSYLETHRDEVVDIPLEEDFKCTFLQGAAAAEHSARVNDEYLKRMSKRGEWGDGVMLSSACRVYSRQINVVLAGSNVVVPLGPTSSSGDCHNPISLGYISDIKHYVFLQPKGTVSHSDISKQSTTTISVSTTSLNAAEHCASASDTDTVATSPYNAKLSVDDELKVAAVMVDQNGQSRMMLFKALNLVTTNKKENF